MRRILRSVEECAKMVDVAIQHHPEISALVWAGARFILMVSYIRGCCNIYIDTSDTSSTGFNLYIDSLEAAIVEKMATCEFYAHIYDEGLRVRLANSTTTKAFDGTLDAALKNLYEVVQAFLN